MTTDHEEICREATASCGSIPGGAGSELPRTCSARGSFRKFEENELASLYQEQRPAVRGSRFQVGAPGRRVTAADVSGCHHAAEAAHPNAGTCPQAGVLSSMSVPAYGSSPRCADSSWRRPPSLRSSTVPARPAGHTAVSGMRPARRPATAYSGHASPAAADMSR
jgi:hypothetical protein